MHKHQSINQSINQSISRSKLCEHHNCRATDNGGVRVNARILPDVALATLACLHCAKFDGGWQQGHDQEEQ
jgi:hypothetical protein